MADNQNSVEEWRDIPGFENYQVSTLGRVRLVRVLKPWVNPISDYLYIALGRAFSGTVHRLVCRVFHGEPTSPDLVVAHFDGNRQNNRPENLRWATRSENTQDAVRHGTSKLNQYRTDGYRPRYRSNPLRGEAAPSAKLNTEKAAEIRSRHAAGETMDELARDYSVGKSTIFRVLKGALWN